MAYLINRTVSQVLDFKTHLICCVITSPVSVSKLALKVLRCAYVHIYSHKRSELDSCALRCVFISYSTTHNGYKCYHPYTQKVHVTLDVTFHEDVPYYVSHSSPIQGKKGSELESCGVEYLRLNNVCEDIGHGQKTIGRPSGSDQSPKFGAEDNKHGFKTTGL